MKKSKLIPYRELQKVLKDPIVKVISNKAETLINATLREPLVKRWGCGFTIIRKGKSRGSY